MGGSSSHEVTQEETTHPDNTKLVHEGWSSLREKKRGCTDCLCLLLLIAAWIAMTAVGFIACGVIDNPQLPPGNPQVLINAVDYDNNICGIDSSVKHKKFGFYLLDKSVVCVESCPSQDDFTKFVCQYDIQTQANNDIIFAMKSILERKCMYQLKTKEAVNRCVPTSAIELASKIAATGGFNVTGQVQYQSAVGYGSGWFNKFLSDVWTLRGIVFGIGIGVSTFLAFLYLYFLRIPVLLTFIIWSMILYIFVLLLMGAFLLWSLANSWKSDGVHSQPEVSTMYVFSYVFMGASFLYFCLMLVMRSRVQLAIGIIQQAARALASMPALLLTPIIQVTAITAFMVPWIIYIFYLASSGSIVQHTGTYHDYLGQKQTYTYKTFDYTMNTKYAFLYMIFCYFWTSQFVVACGQILIALAFSNWYFTRDKSMIGTSSILWAIYATFRYHLGTVAFGSLIIAIIKTIRVVLAYLQKKAKKSHNKIAEYLLCVLQCCMWCLEKIMKFVNKNAYIQTAIYGTSFCTSARKAFFLILRNILRVWAVNMVADFVLLLGKIIVPVMTVFLAYLCMAYGTTSTEVNGIIAPLVLTALLSYFVASMFSEIFGMGIETIMCCYVADEEMFAPADRFADGGLKSSIQRAAEMAAAKQKAKIMPTHEVHVIPSPPPELADHADHADVAVATNQPTATL